MKIIGICGRSGSGKTTVGEIIQKKYSAYIDCDKISKVIMTKDSACVAELVGAFGREILFDDGSLNRALVASIAFQNKENTLLLNRITHKHILNEVEKRISEYNQRGEKIIFIDAPTLFESGLDSRCDVIIAVIANEENLITRIRGRDGKSDCEINKRLHSQHDSEFLRKKAHFCIENNGTLSELEQNVNLVLSKIEEEVCQKN